MPSKQRRDLSIIAECLYCGKSFSPFRGRPPQYCSVTCRRREMTERFNGKITKSRTGTLPTDTASTQDILPPPDLPLSPEDLIRERQEVWESGQRYEQISNTLLNREQQRTNTRTIIVAGHGAHMQLEFGDLRVHQGTTHTAPAPDAQILNRGLPNDP